MENEKSSYCCSDPIPPACMSRASKKDITQALFKRGCCAKCGMTKENCNGFQPCPNGKTPNHPHAKTAMESSLQDLGNCIKIGLKGATKAIMTIGQYLTEAKAILGHGNFLPWIEAEFQMSHDTAKNFMNVWERFGQNPKISEFQPSALYLLASPSTPDEAREEALDRAEKGEKITHKTAREIKEKHAPAKEKKTPAEPRTKPEKNRTTAPAEVIPPDPPAEEGEEPAFDLSALEQYDNDAMNAFQAALVQVMNDHWEPLSELSLGKAHVVELVSSIASKIKMAKPWRDE